MCKKCLRMRLLFGAVGFVAGVATGAGGMYLYARKRMKDDAETIENLIDEINKVNGANTIYGLRTEDELQEEIDTVEATEEYQKAASKYYIPRSNDKPSLTDLAEQAGIKTEIEKIKEEEDEEVEAWNDPDNAEEEEKPDDPRDEYDGPATPHQITEEEFLEDDLFDKDQLTYYIDDDTLCDIDDNVLNVDEYLGDYNAFSGAIREAMRKHEVLLYWRIPSIDEDVEIELKQTSYSAYVLGIDPDDVGGFERRAGRKQVSEEDDE